ncbi:MAG: hypothetical protein WCS03_09095 [Bacteroidota bacterium]
MEEKISEKTAHVCENESGKVGRRKSETGSRKSEDSSLKIYFSG